MNLYSTGQVSRAAEGHTWTRQGLADDPAYYRVRLASGKTRYAKVRDVDNGTSAMVRLHTTEYNESVMGRAREARRAIVSMFHVFGYEPWTAKTAGVTPQMIRRYPDLIEVCGLELEERCRKHSNVYRFKKNIESKIERMK